MRTDGDLKVVVTISASINAHPAESSRKGHSLKTILWYFKLTQKLKRKNNEHNNRHICTCVGVSNTLFSFRYEIIFRAFWASFQKVEELIKLAVHVMCAIMFANSKIQAFIP